MTFIDFIHQEASRLTRVCRRRRKRGVVEVAVPVVPAGGLVVEVHGDGGVGDEAIRASATAAGSQHNAVLRLRARVVQVRYQRRSIGRRLRHAPSFL